MVHDQRPNLSAHVLHLLSTGRHQLFEGAAEARRRGPSTNPLLRLNDWDARA
jgi:hypothetical protein